jgi:hypothetical protein
MFWFGLIVCGLVGVWVLGLDVERFGWVRRGDEDFDEVFGLGSIFFVGC